MDLRMKVFVHHAEQLRTHSGMCFFSFYLLTMVAV